jgi:hypothetical protein
LAREKRQLGLTAMYSSIERVRVAQADVDDEAFYASVAEAVWWLATLDESLWGTEIGGRNYESVRESCREGVLLLGVRYARNRQVHDVEVTAMQGNPLLGSQSRNGLPWTWRSLDADGVPPFTTRESEWGRRGESTYIELMSGMAVLDTLEAASGFLNYWVEELHGEDL